MQSRGLVVGTTIDQFADITLREPKNKYNFHTRVCYRQIEEVLNNDQIQHNGFRTALKYFGVKDGLDLSYHCDLPRQWGGLASSSAFYVALVHALYKYKGIEPSVSQLSEDALKIERGWNRERGGCQDSIMVAAGGFVAIEFDKELITWYRLNIPAWFKEELQNQTLLFFTGVSRLASEATESYADKMRENPINYELVKLADKSISFLTNCNLSGFAECVNKNWQLKRQLSDKVSSDRIDEIYKIGMENGALAGKLNGAGSGGVFTFIAPQEKHWQIKKALGLWCLHVKFIEKGSSIIWAE